MSRVSFFTVSLLYLIVTLYVAMTTPISPHEAYTLYYKDNIDHFLMQQFMPYIEGFFAFRVPFYFLGGVNILIYYALSKFYFKEQSDRYLSTVIFMLLPGIITSMILVNISVLVITLVLIFLLGYKHNWWWLQVISLIVLLFVHDSAIIFFISLAFYAYLSKEHRLFYFSLLLMFMSLFIGTLEIGGRPRGHFIEIFGLYVALFSPLVFVYFCYTLYRIHHEKKHDIIWYISTIGLLFSLFLSIRQRVAITEFAPYILIGTVFILRAYNESLKVRLKIYQKKYKRIFFMVMVTLVLGSITILFHKVLFSLFEDKSRHFAYTVYKPYWLAKKLKLQKSECYDTKFVKMRAQLRYYSIKECQSVQK